MATARNPVDDAFDRIAVLRRIVSAERQRATSKPLDTRNFEFGFLPVRRYEDRDEAEREIVATFNALELLLDHFNILHMAASFEQAARVRIGNAIGVARGAIEKDRKSGERWPVKLVREADTYGSLQSISELLSLVADDKAAFEAIRRVRNNLGHGVPITNVPAITAESARVILAEALERLKV